MKGGGVSQPQEEPAEGAAAEGAAAHALPEGCPALGDRSAPRSSLGSSRRSDVCPAPAALPSQSSKAPVC